MRITIVFLLGVVMVLANTQVQAADREFLDTTGTVTSVDDGKPPVGLPTSPTILPSENINTLFNIRCWQNGQLILEDTNWSAPQLSTHFIALRKVGSPAPGIYLVDFQHTFCELKQR